MIEIREEFKVPASPDKVMQRFMNVDEVASCVPGVTLTGRTTEGEYMGTMAVAFGPKRLKFDGKLQCEFDAEQRTGVLTGGGMAGRGAAVKMRTEFAVIDSSNGGDPESTVRVQSRAELGGVLAQFATTGGAILAKQVMNDFGACLAARLAEDAPAQSIEEGRKWAVDHRAPAFPRPPAGQLSAFSLVWRTLVSSLRGLFGRGRREVQRHEGKSV